jgi:hypothetical protein
MTVLFSQVEVQSSPTTLEALRRCRLLQGSPGAARLLARGFEPDAAASCGIRFCADWLDRGPALVFPIRDGRGKPVGAIGRLLQPVEGRGWLPVGEL